MNRTRLQTLLLPLRSTADGELSWFDWLIDPLPKRFMLPATGLLILGLDWLLFSKEAVSFGLLIPFALVVGFVAGGICTYLLQTSYGGDTKLAAGLKSLLAGVLVGLPFPLAGTVVGGLILAGSGLAGIRWRLLQSRFTRRAQFAKCPTFTCDYSHR